MAIKNGDDDANTTGEGGAVGAGNGRAEGVSTRDGELGGDAESYSEADELRNAEDTRAADWWLAEPPDALRELAEDFERVRSLQRIFGYRDCGVLRAKLARKIDRLFPWVKICSGHID